MCEVVPSRNVMYKICKMLSLLIKAYIHTMETMGSSPPITFCDDYGILLILMIFCMKISPSFDHEFHKS